MGRLSRETWAAHVIAWRNSGKSAEEFAATAGLTAARLAYWASRVGRDGGARRRRCKAAVPETAIAVRPTGPGWFELMAGARAAEASPARSAPMLEVLAASGRVVRVPVGFDAETLGRVLAAVEAA